MGNKGTDETKHFLGTQDNKALRFRVNNKWAGEISPKNDNISLGTNANNNNMKSILCFGDSNTWGYDPATKTRFSRDKRWTGLLQKYLGSEYYIVEEGLNGRTTNIDEKEEWCFYLIYKEREGITKEHF